MKSPKADIFLMKLSARINLNKVLKIKTFSLEDSLVKKNQSIEIKLTFLLFLSKKSNISLKIFCEKKTVS